MGVADHFATVQITRRYNCCKGYCGCLEPSLFGEFIYKNKISVFQ